jgi:hypothetical protein
LAGGEGEPGAANTEGSPMKSYDRSEAVRMESNEPLTYILVS